MIFCITLIIFMEKNILGILDILILKVILTSGAMTQNITLEN